MSFLLLQVNFDRLSFRDRSCRCSRSLKWSVTAAANFLMICGPFQAGRLVLVMATVGALDSMVGLGHLSLLNVRVDLSVSKNPIKFLFLATPPGHPEIPVLSLSWISEKPLMQLCYLRRCKSPVPLLYIEL